MPFDPKSLPPPVFAAYRQGSRSWPLVVQKAVQSGIKDVDFLTSVVFYLHHPERNGRPIETHELVMIAQWKSFRVSVMLQIQAGGASSKPSPGFTKWDIPNTWVTSYSGG